LPQIQVAFDIDSNGIVTVSAKDMATGKAQQISIKSNGGLTDEEIAQMVRAAEENAEQDRKRKELAEVRNTADAMIANTEKTLRENADTVPDNLRVEIESAALELKQAMKDSDDAAVIREATTEYVNTTMKLGELLYKQEPTVDQPSAAS
jgi:molecular chaperone DnaK